MKKMLFVISFIIVLFACQKEDEYCWLCNERVVYSAPGYVSDTIKSEYQKCGYTNDEISEYEKDKIFIGTQTVGGVTINVDSFVRCGRMVCI
jgi:hypothetical protein